MKDFAILYDFTTGLNEKGTNEYSLQANDLTEAREKFYRINKGYSSIKIRNIKEYNNEKI